MLMWKKEERSIMAMSEKERRNRKRNRRTDRETDREVVLSWQVAAPGNLSYFTRSRCFLNA